MNQPLKTIVPVFTLTIECAPTTDMVGLMSKLEQAVGAVDHDIVNVVITHEGYDPVDYTKLIADE